MHVFILVRLGYQVIIVYLKATLPMKQYQKASKPFQWLYIDLWMDAWWRYYMKNLSKLPAFCDDNPSFTDALHYNGQ